jgi:hypothetical protein
MITMKTPLVTRWRNIHKDDVPYLKAAIKQIRLRTGNTGLLLELCHMDQTWSFRLWHNGENS